jgi:hypothetical protein
MPRIEIQQAALTLHQRFYRLSSANMPSHVVEQARLVGGRELTR